MTVWFVTRHSGAIEWASLRLHIKTLAVSHLDICNVKMGDTVLGTLPVHLAAEVCARGARYLHLSLDVPAERRGDELSAADMEAFGARLEEYSVERKVGEFDVVTD